MSGVSTRQPASVYRRRRLAVFGGLIAVIAVVVLIIVRPSIGGTTVAEVAPDETLAAEEVAVAACMPSQIELTPQTDEQRYSTGLNPSVWLTVKNVGAIECELEVGTDVQEYIIDSGSRDNPDLIWSSAHCQDAGVPMTITLQPGQERSTGSLVWDRTRSSANTCNDARPTMPGGGASYHLSVKLGPFESDSTRQFILD
jgi:hypothetical protein